MIRRQVTVMSLFFSEFGDFKDTRDLGTWWVLYWLIPVFSNSIYWQPSGQQKNKDTGNLQPAFHSQQSGLDMVFWHSWPYFWNTDYSHVSLHLLGLWTARNSSITCFISNRSFYTYKDLSSYIFVAFEHLTKAFVESRNIFYFSTL